MTRRVAPSIIPDPETINALPKPLRRYIHDLETNADPAGTMRENIRLRQENEMLRKECRQVAAQAARNKGPDAEIVEALLAEAECNVANGSMLVERQRSLVAELLCDGHDITQARAMLHALLNTQCLHVLTRDRLLEMLIE
jgi:hypothetical protein